MWQCFLRWMCHILHLTLVWWIAKASGYNIVGGKAHAEIHTPTPTLTYTHTHKTTTTLTITVSQKHRCTHSIVAEALTATQRGGTYKSCNHFGNFTFMVCVFLFCLCISLCFMLDTDTEEGLSPYSVFILSVILHISWKLADKDQRRFWRRGYQFDETF